MVRSGAISLVPAKGRFKYVLRLTLRVEQRTDNLATVPGAFAQLVCAPDRFNRLPSARASFAAPSSDFAMLNFP